MGDMQRYRTMEEKVLEINRRLKDEGFKTVVGQLIHEDITMVMPKEEMEDANKYNRVMQIIQEEMFLNSF